jgi:hypothetical protein
VQGYRLPNQPLRLLDREEFFLKVSFGRILWIWKMCPAI